MNLVELIMSLEKLVINDFAEKEVKGDRVTYTIEYLNQLIVVSIDAEVIEMGLNTFSVLPYLRNGDFTTPIDYEYFISLIDEVLYLL